MSDRVITIPIATDSVSDDREGFYINLDHATGGSRLAEKSGVVSIIDALQANPGVFSISKIGSGEAIEPPSGSVAATNLRFVVTRTEGRLGAVSVDYSVEGVTATPGLDFAVTSGTLRWGHTATQDQNITVQILADGIAEDVETFRVTLSNPSSGAVVAAASATVSILDSPTGTFVSDGSAGGGGATGALEISLLLGCLLLRAQRRYRMR
jgi:hypothetical protein